MVLGSGTPRSGCSWVEYSRPQQQNNGREILRVLVIVKLELASLPKFEDSKYSTFRINQVQFRRISGLWGLVLVGGERGARRHTSRRCLGSVTYSRFPPGRYSRRHWRRPCHPRYSHFVSDMDISNDGRTNPSFRMTWSGDVNAKFLEEHKRVLFRWHLSITRRKKIIIPWHRYTCQSRYKTIIYLRPSNDHTSIQKEPTRSHHA